MAIGTYYDIYKLDQYKARVSSILSEVSSYNSGGFLEAGKASLRSQIETLKQKEAQMFNLLQVKNIQELNARIEEYKKAVVNFSGVNLQEEFLGILEADNAEEYQSFNEAVFEVLEEQGFDQDELHMMSEAGAEIVLNMLNKGIATSHKFSSKSGLTGRVSPSKFTAHQKKRWKELFKTEEFLQKYPKAKRYAKKFLSSTQPQIQSSGQSTSTSFGSTTIFTWKTGTKGLKYTEAKELYPVGNEELQRINLKMTNFIISKVPQDRELIRAIINHILREDPYVFFVGGNTKDITGILGEISGLYYLSKLFGGFSQKVLQWRGGTHSGFKGAKPHQDVILKDLGIQVKNSVEESLGTISFAGAGIETMLSKAWLPPSVQNVFLNYYGTVAFNVEYHHNGQSYVPGPPDDGDTRHQEFIEWSNKLGGAEEGINRLLSMCAAFFMYMDIYEGANDMDANSLYLLGGTMFQTASNILSSILKKLEMNERTGFNIRASYKQDGRNIISALNSDTRDRDYSKVVIGNIELKSSYDFSHLLKT